MTTDFFLLLLREVQDCLWCRQRTLMSVGKRAFHLCESRTVKVCIAKSVFDLFIYLIIFV
jgi:hypothetical protein